MTEPASPAFVGLQHAGCEHLGIMVPADVVGNRGSVELERQMLAAAGYHRFVLVDIFDADLEAAVEQWAAGHGCPTCAVDVSRGTLPAVRAFVVRLRDRAGAGDPSAIAYLTRLSLAGATPGVHELIVRAAGQGLLGDPP